MWAHKCVFLLLVTVSKYEGEKKEERVINNSTVNSGLKDLSEYNSHPLNVNKNKSQAELDHKLSESIKNQVVTKNIRSFIAVILKG